MAGNTTKGRLYNCPPMPAVKLLAIKKTQPRPAISTPKKVRKTKEAAKLQTELNKQARLEKHLRNHPTDYCAHGKLNGKPVTPKPSKLRCYTCGCKIVTAYESRLLNDEVRGERRADFCKSCATGKRKGTDTRNKAFANAFSAEYRRSLPKHLPITCIG